MPNDEKLLTIEEQDVCQKIAASGGLVSQRAAALLALDQGATRAQASEQTGLTLGQIGYLLRAFGQKRLDLFPDAGPLEEEKEEQPPAEPTETKEDKKEKAKKPKKGKKDKTMAKAKKKDKKPKKDKAKAKAKKGKKDKESKKDKAAKKKAKKK